MKASALILWVGEGVEAFLADIVNVPIRCLFGEAMN